MKTKTHAELLQHIKSLRDVFEEQVELDRREKASWLTGTHEGARDILVSLWRVANGMKD